VLDVVEAIDSVVVEDDDVDTATVDVVADGRVDRALVTVDVPLCSLVLGGRPPVTSLRRCVVATDTAGEESGDGRLVTAVVVCSCVGASKGFRSLTSSRVNADAAVMVMIDRAADPMPTRTKAAVATPERVTSAA
jgi:hypothetical protein